MRHLLLFLMLMFSSIAGLWSQTPMKVAFGDIRARSIGPAVMSGRVSSVDGSALRPELLYVGAASGGVWKSINGGASFSSVFDEHPPSIGDICIDREHPDTVWVGTGEPWVRNSTSVGAGLFVTTNAGRDWSFKGLAQTERIAKVLIDPRNTAVVYVAAQGRLWSSDKERGVYRSEDFGQTWSQVLYIDENTGCADLTINPGNPDELFAALWEHRRYPDFFQSGGPGSGLYRSTDGGKSWTHQSGNGLPEGNLGRMAVEFAPSNPSVVFLTVEAEQKENSGLYKSTDGGQTWTLMNRDFNMTVRPFYFSRLTVDPSDENKLFKCGLNLSISEDGGNSFRQVGSGVHSDIHDVWVNPRNTKQVLIGTDGGTYMSLDGGHTFKMFMDLPISQFYHVSVDNDEPFNVYGGLQDNGSWYGPSASPGGVENKDWELSNWGDGFYSFRHPTDPNIIYSESQGGNLVRFDKSDGQSKDIQPIARQGEPEYRFNWNTPIHVSPNNPERLYFASQFLFVTEDRGDSWRRISPDLTTNDPQRQRQKQSGGFSIDNSGAENNTTIYAIAESPVDERTIWVGTDDGLVQVTKDAGNSWSSVADRLPALPQGLWVSSLEPSHFDENTGYVTVDGHRSGDMQPYVFKTTDRGASWTSLVTADIEGYARVLREDLENPALLFLGTEVGLYISVDGGLSWKRFDNGLPKAPVYALAIHPREAALVIATHGRGIYLIDDLLPLRQLNETVMGQALHFFETKPAYIRLPRQGNPFGGAGNFIGANPNEQAYIAYFMKRRHTFGKMMLEMYDESGKLVNELIPGKSAGINLVWLPTQLRMPKGAPTRNVQALGSSIFPPAIPEGVYTVRILKGKEVYEQKLTLRFDPRADSKYPAEDRELAYSTQMRLYQLTERIGYIYYAMEDMHRGAASLVGQAKKRLASDLAVFAEEVEQRKNGIVSLEGDGYVNESSRLREEVAMLYGRISRYPGRPTDGQLHKTEVLEKEMDTLQSQFDAFWLRLKKLNSDLTKQGMTPIDVRTWEEFIRK